MNIEISINMDPGEKFNRAEFDEAVVKVISELERKMAPEDPDPDKCEDCGKPYVEEEDEGCCSQCEWAAWSKTLKSQENRASLANWLREEKIVVADDESRRALQEMFPDGSVLFEKGSGKPDVPTKKMLVIKGPIQSGKTKLARKLIEMMYGGDVLKLANPTCKKELPRIVQCLHQEPRYIYFENVDQKNWKVLEGFFEDLLTYSTWGERRKGTSEWQTVDISKLQIIVTWSAGLKWVWENNPDLAWRSRVVTLQEWGGEK